MTLRTLLRFLFGQRQAILRIAETPNAVWLGLLLVLSAAFAREYDGEDLLHAPWHVGLPLAASVVTSSLLFGLVWLVSRGARPAWKDLPRGFQSFLGVYWMTAPLAWLYAIPVERFWSAADATAANLWLLGLVAAWRVLLMVRVVTILYGASVWQAGCLVMLFADAVALAILRLTPLPVFSIMGGIRLSESEQMIQGTTLLIGLCGVLSFPVWFLGTAVVAYRKRLTWQTATAAASCDRRVAASAWAVGVLSLLIWIPVLPLTQPEQQLRHAVERDLREGNIYQALATMSAHPRDAFPPHWDPPPRIGYGERQPPILDVVEVALAMDADPWVVDVFMEKLRSLAGRSYGPLYFLSNLSDEEFDRYLSVLEQLPADSEIIDEQREALERQADEESQRTAAQRDRLRGLLQRGDILGPVRKPSSR